MITDKGKKMVRLITFFLGALLSMTVTGCGRVTDTTNESSTVDQTFPPAGNDKSEYQNEGLGWYSDDAVFAGQKIVEGVWSVYKRTDYAQGSTEFYDLYDRGYDFRGYGEAFIRFQTKAFSNSAQWGVDADGTKLALSDYYAYIYKSVFSNDDHCFNVLQNSVTVRFCHEAFVDANTSNSAGYYGANVKFGNRTNYNFTAVGQWEISPFEGGQGSTVTLDADGSTSGGGEWGESRDGKVMTIDGTSYLVFRYLTPPDDNCIAVYELADNDITDTVWKMCKR